MIYILYKQLVTHHFVPRAVDLLTELDEMRTLTVHSIHLERPLLPVNDELERQGARHARRRDCSSAYLTTSDHHLSFSMDALSSLGLPSTTDSRRVSGRTVTARAGGGVCERIQGVQDEVEVETEEDGRLLWLIREMEIRELFPTFSATVWGMD